MTKKRYVIMLLVSVVMLITASAMILLKKNKPMGSGMVPLALRPLQMKDGWGYEVLVDNKLFIHQDCIPAISSFKKFSTESEALLIGNRVVDRLKHGHKPVITLQDISEAHIHY